MTQRILNAEPSNPTEVAFEDRAPLAAAVPPGRFVLPGLPPVTDQGTDGTCVAHAVGNVVAWHHRRKYGTFPDVDHRAFYTLIRKAVGAPPDPTFSQGLTLLWALRTAKGSGVPLIGGGRTPRITGFALAGLTFDEIQRAIWEHQSPAAIRTAWDANWFVLPVSRIVKPPVGQTVGGHALMTFGFDDQTAGRPLECAINRNSWGLAWRTSYHPDAYLDPRGIEGWLVSGIE